MHSIELLLDDDRDASIRAQWLALMEAGLPSLARHRSASNAPHVTLVARTTIDGSQDPAVRPWASELPLPFHFGGLLVFGRASGSLVLARAVVADARILRFHARVHEAMGTPAGDVPHTLPGEWTPHVTLASRLTTVQVGAALATLGDVPTPDGGSFTALRRWDSDERTITRLD